MFYLHISNRTENLLRHLAEVIRADGQPDLFAPELFLIQSQGMERMIAQTLADEFRSFCNFKFFLPLEFLEFIAGKLGLGIASNGFQRQILSWRIEGLLRNLSGDQYLPLSAYLQGENSGLKRFQLARRLANIFDQYQLMRPGMLMKWERDEHVGDHPAEGWQMHLWQRLLTQVGGEVHRGILFRRVIEHLDGEKSLDEPLPKRISVIGLHTIPPIYLNYLNSLSSQMDVHLFLLSPCRNYWGNVESMRMQFKHQARQTTDPVEYESEQHHPLLSVLGRQGRDLQNIMLDNADFALEFSSYGDPLSGEDYAKGSLLQKVQKDLLEGSLPQEQQAVVEADDDSIQVVSCHSRLREMSVLKDHLLRLLHRDPELELRDIVVMAPDIQDYAPLIPAVFEDIQHSIADRSIRRGNAVLAAFLCFLDLFSGRFGWSEVLDLLRKPVVYPQFELSAADLDSLEQWVTAAGIRWGLSGQQRGEEGLPDFSETSWRAGLDRLLMGYAIEVDDFIDGVLPYPDIEGRGAQALGGLCRFVELIETARLDFQQNRGLHDWSTSIQTLIPQLFGDQYERELLELRTLVEELDEAGDGFHSGQVSFEVIREWLNQSAKESRSSSGFLRGQLTFCSMLPMRSIPFKVVCLTGLCDGVFPKNESHDTFDLMASEFRPGDRSPRADDRYQFMEALLSAREHLYISYIGQSIRTNEPIPPSVVVTEFLEVLENIYGAKELVNRHPLHPFSRRYFRTTSDSRLFSYDGYCCKTAELLQQGAQPVFDWWQGTIDGNQPKDKQVRLVELLRFYTNPQKYFVKNILGIQLDTARELPEDREMFESLGLDKYFIEEELVQTGLDGGTVELLEKTQAQGLWPLGTSGRLAFEEKQADIEKFLVKVREQQMGEKLSDIPVDLTVGDYRLSGALGNLYENGLMLVRYGKLRGRDLLSGWIHHLLLHHLQSISMPTQSTITRIVTQDKVVGFSGAPAEAALENLLKHFDFGNRTPSMFFVEPAFAYATQLASARAKIQPLDKAGRLLNMRLEKGYEPEWELLFRGHREEVELAPEFEQLCLELMCPIWSAVDE